LDVVENKHAEHLVRDSGCLLTVYGRACSKLVMFSELPVTDVDILGGILMIPSSY